MRGLINDCIPFVEAPDRFHPTSIPYKVPDWLQLIYLFRSDEDFSHRLPRGIRNCGLPVAEASLLFSFLETHSMCVSRSDFKNSFSDSEYSSIW